MPASDFYGLLETARDCKELLGTAKACEIFQGLLGTARD
jgi:hypothetical protein